MSIVENDLRAILAFQVKQYLLIFDTLFEAKVVFQVERLYFASSHSRPANSTPILGLMSQLGWIVLTVTQMPCIPCEYFGEYQ